MIPIAWIATVMNVSISKARSRLIKIVCGGMVSIEDLNDWVEYAYRRNPVQYKKWIEFLRRMEARELGNT
ncbi:MAG: hypothetical protein L6290_10320 [Thermodesulfovibrionales bacterium]|nr:hypothetical protein [Thermodesulfovibrionales bacterium]